jgi:purine nucleosidase
MFAADPVAMAVAIDPGIVMRSERRHVTVELGGRHTRGQTTVDWFSFGGEPPNVEVVLAVDADLFWKMLRASVG